MRRVLALTLLAGAVAAIVPAAFAEPSQTVTLTVIRSVDQSTGLPKVRFTGTISSAAQGEDVTVMQQTCGLSFSTAVAGTQTQSGGGWEAEPSSQYVIAPSATFRARWKDTQSEPVVVHPQIPVFLIPIATNRLRTSVSIERVPQDMRGKLVVLQRLVKKKWTTVERKRFVLDRLGSGGPITYATTFTTAKRGWTVRALVPSKSAGPCFKSNATEKVRLR